MKLTYCHVATLLTFIAWCGMIGISTASGANNDDVGKKLGVIKAISDRISNYEWKFHTTFHALRTSDDPKSVVETKSIFKKGRVRYEAHSQRHLIELQQVMRWIDGKAPNYGEDLRFSFDGHVFRIGAWEQPGSIVPSPMDLPGRGKIKQQPDNSLALYGLASGLAYLPPYIWTHEDGIQPLADLLRSKLNAGLSVSIDGDDDIWDIKFPDGEDIVQLKYSASMGGAVLEATWARGNPPVVWERIVVESYDTNRDGYWIPKRVNMIETLAKPPSLARTDFADVRVNIELDDNTFRVAFPPGTKVDDEIKKVSYIVGQTPEDDQRAVASFRARHNLPLATQPIAVANWPLRRILLVGLNAICVIGLIALLLWRRLKSRWVTLSVAALLSMSQVCVAEESASQVVVTQADGENIYVSQCGFLVAAFTLDDFGIKYDANNVYRELRPTLDGVTMSDLKDVLEGCGLRVIARQDVGIGDIARELSSANLGIFPMDGRIKARHYYIAMLAADSSPVVVDVPVGVAPLMRVNDQGLAKHDGLVLFVSKDLQSRSMADRVLVSPKIIDLGETPVAGTNAHRAVPAVLTIENPTDSSIMLSGIQTSCGCTKPNWKGGLLRPSEKREITFEISPASWGEGSQSKQALLRFADDTSLAVEIRAFGITPEIVHQLRSSTKSIVLDVTNDLAGKLPKQVLTRFSITGGDEILKKVTFSSDADWLRGVMGAIRNGSREIELKAELTEAVAEKLRPAPTEICRRLFLKSEVGKEPVTVDVKLVSRSLLNVRPAIVKVAKGESGKSIVMIRAIPSPTESLHVRRLWSTPDGLLLHSDQSIYGGVQISVSAEASTKPGTYIVGCELDSFSPQENASFVVQVSTDRGTEGVRQQ